MARRPAELLIALVLHLADYGEADIIATLLTPSHGRVSAFARSARRSKKRFGGRLQLGAQLRCRAHAPRQDSELWQLEDIDTAQHPPWARPADNAATVLDRVLASYVLDLGRSCTPAGQADHELYAMLQRAIWRPGGANPHHFMAWLHMQLLRVGGVAPELDRCCACSRLLTADDGAILQREDVGVRCVPCGRSRLVDPAALQLSPLTRQALVAVAANQPPTHDRIGMPLVRASRMLMEQVHRHPLVSAEVVDSFLPPDSPVKR